jgi:hypothetical protein
MDYNSVKPICSRAVFASPALKINYNKMRKVGATDADAEAFFPSELPHLFLINRYLRFWRNL